MFNQVKTVIRHIFTGKDNTTYDLGRISWAVNNISLIIFAVSNVYHSETHTLDLVTFANACAICVGAHGLALWSKKNTEPEPTTQQ